MNKDGVIEKFLGGFSIDNLTARLSPKFKPENDREQEQHLHSGFYDYSTEGFIGPNEDIIQTVVEDFETVQKYGTTYEEIADKLTLFVRKIEFEKSLSYKMGPIGSILSSLYKFSSRNYGLNNGFYAERAWSSSGCQGCPWEEMNNDFSSYSGRHVGTIFEGIPDVEEKLYVEMAIKGKLNTDKKWLADMEPTKKPDKNYGIVTSLLPHLIKDHCFFEGKGTIYRAEPELLIKALGIAK